MTSRNWAEISRGVLRHNWAHVRRVVPAASEICAVVKADAYGHGALACAREFERLGAGWLAVTSVEEGARLRQGGLVARILVLAGFARGEAPALVDYHLTPAVWDVAQLDWLGATTTEPMAVHLKLDSGMARLGITPGQEASVGLALQRWPQLRVEAVFSHLAASEAADDSGSHEQHGRFHAAAGRMGFSALPWHLLNSEGALRFSSRDGWSGSLVRVGLALYGYSSQPRHAQALQPALSWKTTVLSLKDVPAGQAVGYGGLYRTAAPSRLAVIAAGYADGYRRDLSPGARVTLAQGSAPVVGAISMDLITVDATGVPVALGDEVSLLGAGVTAADLAAHVGTIPYEILCGLSARVERRYVD